MKRKCDNCKWQTLKGKFVSNFKNWTCETCTLNPVNEDNFEPKAGIEGTELDFESVVLYFDEDKKEGIISRLDKYKRKSYHNVYGFFDVSYTHKQETDLILISDILSTMNWLDSDYLEVKQLETKD